MDRDTISIDLVGRLLRELQGLQRTQSLLREDVRLLTDRVANLETLLTGRLDQLDRALSQKGGT